MTSLVWLFAVLSVAVQAGDVRDNGGNCVGVKSCRPRCVTFRVDRETQDCGSRTGIFQVQSDLNPWDIKRFRSINCNTSDTCINNLCDQDLSGDLTVRIGEEGHSGSLYFTSIYLAEDDDKFTDCSIYPCPKDECSVPEQMVSLWLVSAKRFSDPRISLLPVASPLGIRPWVRLYSRLGRP
jgi:hypothetical protein